MGKPALRNSSRWFVGRAARFVVGICLLAPAPAPRQHSINGCRRPCHGRERKREPDFGLESGQADTDSEGGVRLCRSSHSSFDGDAGNSLRPEKYFCLKKAPMNGADVLFTPFCA